MTSVRDIIDANLAEDREGKEKKNWYASDLGKCLCAAYLKRKGEEPTNKPDARSLRIFSIGNTFEQWLFKNVQKKYLDAYQPSESIYIPEWDLSVRPDGIIPSEKLVLEFKTVHSRKFWHMEKEGGADRHYLMQLYAGMYATKIHDGLLVYASKDDLAMAEFHLELTNKDIREAIETDIATLKGAWAAQVPPKPSCVGTWMEKYCDYGSRCKEILESGNYYNHEGDSENNQ